MNRLKDEENKEQYKISIRPPGLVLFEFSKNTPKKFEELFQIGFLVIEVFFDSKNPNLRFEDVLQKFGGH